MFLTQPVLHCLASHPDLQKKFLFFSFGRQSNPLLGDDITLSRLLLENFRSMTAFVQSVSELGDAHLMSSESWLVQHQAFPVTTYESWAFQWPSLGPLQAEASSQKLGEI